MGCGFSGGTVVCASKYFRLFGGLAWQRNPGGTDEGDHIIVNCDAVRATSITYAVQNRPSQVEAPSKDFNLWSFVANAGSTNSASHHKWSTPVMCQIFGLALHLFDASGCLEAHIRKIIFIWQRFFPLQRLTIRHFFPGSLTHRKSNVPTPWQPWWYLCRSYVWPRLPRPFQCWWRYDAATRYLSPEQCSLACAAGLLNHTFHARAGINFAPRRNQMGQASQVPEGRESGKNRWTAWQFLAFLCNVPAGLLSDQVLSAGDQHLQEVERSNDQRKFSGKEV